MLYTSFVTSGKPVNLPDLSLSLREEDNNVGSKGDKQDRDTVSTW